jgi:HSP20 family protein
LPNRSPEERDVEPIRNAVGRAWESLSEGWRELLTRSAGAVTHFGVRRARGQEREPEFAQWSLLAAETWETAQSVVIRAEIPGMNKEDFAIEVHGNMLRIRGERRADGAEPGRTYHLAERAFGRFERDIPLPHGVLADQAEVSYRDGVVVVILPKSEPVPPRRLPTPG